MRVAGTVAAVKDWDLRMIDWIESTSALVRSCAWVPVKNRPFPTWAVFASRAFAAEPVAKPTVYTSMVCEPVRSGRKSRVDMNLATSSRYSQPSEPAGSSTSPSALKSPIRRGLKSEKPTVRPVVFELPAPVIEKLSWVGSPSVIKMTKFFWHEHGAPLVGQLKGSAGGVVVLAPSVRLY